MDFDQIHTIGEWFTLITSVLGCAYGYGKLSERIEKLEEYAKSTCDMSKNLQDKLATANVNLNNQLSDFKTKISDVYATKSGLDRIEERYLTVLNEIRGDIKGMSSRIDRILER